MNYAFVLAIAHRIARTAQHRKLRKNTTVFVFCNQLITIITDHDLFQLQCCSVAVSLLVKSLKGLTTL
jgi:hypothetical protein